MGSWVAQDILITNSRCSKRWIIMWIFIFLPHRGVGVCLQGAAVILQQLFDRPSWVLSLSIWSNSARSLLDMHKERIWQHPKEKLAFRTWAEKKNDLSEVVLWKCGFFLEGWKSSYDKVVQPLLQLHVITTSYGRGRRWRWRKIKDSLFGASLPASCSCCLRDTY